MKKTNTICTAAAVCSSLLLIAAITLFAGCLETEPQTHTQVEADTVRNDSLPEANTYTEPQFSGSPEAEAGRSPVSDSTADTAAAYGLPDEPSENTTDEQLPVATGTETEPVYGENGNHIE